MDITIYHNPNCGTSRNVVALVKQAGHDPKVVEYLKAGWTKAQLAKLFKAAGLTPRQALREKGSPAEELGLLKDGVKDDAILEAMIQHPILVNRPFVATPKSARLCRPADLVKELIGGR